MATTEPEVLARQHIETAILDCLLFIQKNIVTCFLIKSKVYEVWHAASHCGAYSDSNSRMQKKEKGVCRPIHAASNMSPTLFN